MSLGGRMRTAIFGAILVGLAACGTAPGGRETPGLAGVRPVVADTRAGLQCVPYARARSGINIRGDAHLWWDRAAGRYARSNVPAPGSVLVLNGYRDQARGHVAVVTRIMDDRTIVVDHANWLNRGEVTRDTPVMDVSARGDWSAVRVWHIPSGAWGTRVYQARGFIHAFGDLAERR